MSEAQETGEQGDAPLQLPALTPLSAPPPPLASNGSLAPAPSTSDATAAFNFGPTTPGGGIDFTNFLGQYSQSNNGPQAMYGGSSYPPFAPTASSSSATAPAPAQLARDSQSPNLSVSPSLAQEALVPSPSTAPKKATKKRKSNAGKSAGTEDEDDDEAKKKRIKTPRACDSCRRKKIRYAGDISAARGGGRPSGGPSLCGVWQLGETPRAPFTELSNIFKIVPTPCNCLLAEHCASSSRSLLLSLQRNANPLSFTDATPSPTRSHQSVCTVKVTATSALG